MYMYTHVQCNVAKQSTSYNDQLSVKVLGVIISYTTVTNSYIEKFHGNPIYLHRNVMFLVRMITYP